MDEQLEAALDDPQAPAVVARRFDAEADPAELAAWSGAQVHEVADPASDEPNVLLDVPTPKGPRVAVEGDWVVRLGEDTFLPVTPEDFAARFEPLDP